MEGRQDQVQPITLDPAGSVVGPFERLQFSPLLYRWQPKTVGHRVARKFVRRGNKPDREVYRVLAVLQGRQRREFATVTQTLDRLSMNRVASKVFTLHREDGTKKAEKWVDEWKIKGSRTTAGEEGGGGGKFLGTPETI
ncbi:hypothetical protein WN48_07550 [Eufriesea mexicana]|uniref:Uncharacterized protein n=1 Tax=Eufriesea mexicana TaxID=516756 RepID=A0A310SYB1_9HYME|nr:hypothetical protein WN48_07550 [Eufriesea mexicana]